MKYTFESILSALLNQCESNPQTDINQLILAFCKEHNLPKECLQSINLSNDLFDKIDANAQDLAKAKQEGKSRKQWMYSKIADSLSDFSDQQATKVMDAIGETVEAETNKMFNE